MNDHEQKRFNQLYQRHVRALKLHGNAASAIDVYARAVRRFVAYFDCLPSVQCSLPTFLIFAQTSCFHCGISLLDSNKLATGMVIHGWN
jgi:hypothetical protein